MKNILKTALLMFLLTPILSSAQEKKKDLVKIKIVTIDDNGNKKVVEKEFDATGLTAEEREREIDEIKNGAMGKMSQSKNLEIIIDEDVHSLSGDELDDRFSHDGANNEKQIQIYKNQKDRKGGGFDDFEIEMERLGNQMRVLGEDLPRRLNESFPKIYTWNGDNFGREGDTSIRSLDVFPNRPSTEEVNVRFYAPNEGDITITIVDTKGTTVGQDVIPDFKGEFAGQVKLKTLPKGTFFVIVSQGEDGISRKIKLD